MPFQSIKATFGKLFAPIETKSAPVSLDTWGLDAFLTPKTFAGVSVTAESAMRVTAVNTAVSLISSSLRTLPAKLYRRVGESKKLANDHLAFRLIHARANEFTSAGRLRLLLTVDALLEGNGYAVRVGEGDAAELFRVPPSSMSVTLDDYGVPTYSLMTSHGARTYGFRDVLHLPALVPAKDAVCGVSPVYLAREAIASALVMEEHASKLFRDGARPSMAVSYPAEATKISPSLDKNAARRNLVDSTRLSMAGADNSGKLAVLFDGAQATPFAFSSVDAQFLELRRLAIDEIARAFCVPPTMLFELGRGTWGNTEQMGQQFVSYTLLPWIEAWQDAYARVLFDPETDDDLSIEFVVDDLLRADTATRFEAYSKAIAARILNPNEVRAMENRAPYEGGDEFLNPNTTSGANVPAKEAA